MNFKKIILLFVLLIIVGGIAAVAFMDVPVTQKDITKEIPYNGSSPAN